MTGLEAALGEIVAFLDCRRIPYMVIGGIANLVWGVPRATLDIDMTLWVPPKQEGEVVRAIVGRFDPLPEKPLEFLAETRVLPVRASGFKVDLMFGQLPYEQQAVRRAREVELAGRKVRVCSPEDLIVHKILSERPKDIEDVRGLLRRQGGNLERLYLDPLIEGLAKDLSRPEILEFYRAGLAN